MKTSALFSMCLAGLFFLLTVSTSKAKLPANRVDDVTEWRFYFSNNGLEFYTRWKTEKGLGDRYNYFYEIKVVNTTAVKKHFGFSNIEYYNTSRQLISRINGYGGSVQGNGTESGESAGLIFSLPNGYKPQDLLTQLINVEVK